MTELLDPNLLDGLSIYQDVVLAGRTVLRGVRDCGERWQLIEPHLPQAGVVLDIGSNFGWFGLKICETRPECVVASVEADPRSALIQRKVLASHNHRRIALLTARANDRLLSRFATFGQRFEVALCLSILHWLPDHRKFLTQVGQLSTQIVIEYPELDEPDAGSAKIRAEIGDLEKYLRRLFPTRPVDRIGDCASHLSSRHRRPIWLVGAENGLPTASGVHQSMPALDVRALIDNGLCWPPRSWWLEALGQIEDAPSGCVVGPARPAFAAHGLHGDQHQLAQLRGRLNRVPEDSVCPRGGQLRRHVRQAAGSILRRALSPLLSRG